MSPDDRDPAYLHDIFKAGGRIGVLLKGVSLEKFRDDWTSRLAVERLFEIIGEAARRISQETQAIYADIPWREMIGLRNVISHNYDKIDDDEIFQIATKDIPSLIEGIGRILREMDDSSQT